MFPSTIQRLAPLSAAVLLGIAGSAPAQMAPGAASLTVQGMLPDGDYALLSQATGLTGPLTYASSYDGNTWNGTLTGPQSSIHYIGHTPGPMGAMTNWNVNGQVGAMPVLGSGTAQFTPIAGGFSLQVHENLTAGTWSFTVDGTYTGMLDAAGRLNIDNGSQVIADNHNPPPGGPGGGGRWEYSTDLGVWVSIYRQWIPGWGWQDFAYNWSSTQPLAAQGAFNMQQTISRSCYANCDGSTVAPVLNVNDFACFLNRFASGDPWANCDGSTTPPVLNVLDFSCFINKYSAGCPQ